MVNNSVVISRDFTPQTAAAIAQTASQFTSEIRLEAEGASANAKNPAEIAGLPPIQSKLIFITARGLDENKAVCVVSTVVSAGY